MSPDDIICLSTFPLLSIPLAHTHTLLTHGLTQAKSCMWHLLPCPFCLLYSSFFLALVILTPPFPIRTFQLYLAPIFQFSCHLPHVSTLTLMYYCIETGIYVQAVVMFACKRAHTFLHTWKWVNDFRSIEMHGYTFMASKMTYIIFMHSLVSSWLFIHFVL